MALAALAGVVAADHLGRWLVVEDTIRRTQAIVVLGGSVSFRPVEAARLYREGWAPEVWVAEGSLPSTERASDERLPAVPSKRGYREEVLRRSGVPVTAVRKLQGAASNTLEELRLVEAQLAQSGGDSVILVTSKPHTRRVRLTWNAVAHDGRRAVVRYAPDDPYDAGRWWHDKDGTEAVSREALGLLKVSVMRSLWRR